MKPFTVFLLDPETSERYVVYVDVPNADDAYDAAYEKLIAAHPKIEDEPIYDVAVVNGHHPPITNYGVTTVVE